MLVELHREIDSRTQEIAASHGDWPCRKGCDTCCRRLAELPRLTRGEWELVEAGLDRLDHEVLRQVVARIRQGQTPVCPFLDREAGSCLIYDHRPVACRTYGFYVERDLGLYCSEIERRVNSGEMADVVWGNVASIEAKLGARHGEKIGLLDWFSDSPRWSPEPLPTPPSAPPDPCAAPQPFRTAPPSAPR